MLPQNIIVGFKSALKDIPWVYRGNAWFRAAWLKRRNAWLDASYQAMATAKGVGYSADNAIDVLRSRLMQRALEIVPKKKGEFTFVWIGANRDQDFGGFLQSMQRFGKVHYLQKEDGSYGQEFPINGKNEPEVTRRNGTRVLRLVERLQQAGEKIDLVWGQMWANYIDVGALRRIQMMGIPTANVAMDDKLPDMWMPDEDEMLGSVGLAPGIDLFLTSVPQCLIRYAARGCAAIFWPMASDPEIFQAPAAEDRDIPVCFVGNKYGVREQLINFLSSKGIKVEAFGSGWPNGPIPADKVANVFSRSRIILGIGTIGYATDVYTLKLRDFDAAMAGGLYITHRNPELLEMFREGMEVECYGGFEEAASKISYYVNHPYLAQKIGAAAASKARRFHTWDMRIEQVLAAFRLTKI